MTSANKRLMYTQKESKSIENTISDFDTAIPVSINTKVKTNKD